MAIVHVNGKPTDIGAAKLNLVQAAKVAGVEIPHYCWHPALSVVASCRMCLVEAGDRKPDGSVAMQPRLVPACQTPAREGSVVITDSPKVKQAQKATLEYILLDHPLDCPVCDQAGECFLQDYSYRFGNAVSRLEEPKQLYPDKNYIGEQITLFTDRCIMCSRCVRFTREVSGTAELQVINRGNHSEIDIFPGQPCNNALAGNVVDLCPVGALCSKDFLYQQRVWWLKSHDGVCAGCSTGCSIHVDRSKDEVHRLRPRENPLAQGHFMCDEGRFGYKYIHAENRLTRAQRRREQKLVDATWEEVLPAIRAAVAEALTRGAQAVVGVLSPFMTCEEAWLLGKFLKDQHSQARLAMGPVPVVGEDDKYPKNWRNEAVEPTRFTIRAEKCPNRRGVEAILQHFQGEVIPFDRVLDWTREKAVDTLYLAGGYPHAWLDDHAVTTVRGVKTLIVQDILASPLSAAADYLLAGGSFAEREGTFVNHAGLAQSFGWAIRAPGEARADGRILWELSGRRGLFLADVVRKELADAIPWFQPLAAADPSKLGVLLHAEANQGAEVAAS